MADQHPRALVHLPATATGEEVAAIVREHGAVIVDRVAPPELLDRFHAEVQPHLDAAAPGPDEFSGMNTRRVGALVARSAAARELVMHPLALAATGALLADATSFQLHLTQLIAIGSDQPAQYIHRDQWAFDFFPFPAGYDVQCNTIWALTDFTAENGATRVIPGSNQLDDGLQFSQEDTVPAEMERGSVIFYSGRVYHGGGANRTATPRLGVNITYARSWLRQEENQYLSVPLEIARTLPDDLLRVMGYARGAYALGYVGDLEDPLTVVRAEPGRRGFGDMTADEVRELRAATR
jgi:ectoine hydroxylase-related dioxygenase (phytanoyl-CoA dioxygenase family)